MNAWQNLLGIVGRKKIGRHGHDKGCSIKNLRWECPNRGKFLGNMERWGGRGIKGV